MPRKDNTLFENAVFDLPLNYDLRKLADPTYDLAPSDGTDCPHQAASAWRLWSQGLLACALLAAGLLAAEALLHIG